MNIQAILNYNLKSKRKLITNPESPSGPTIYSEDGNYQEYRKDGVPHREGDQPAVIDKTFGTMLYFIDGQLHRENGPAVDAPLIKEYYHHGTKHNEHGPAVISHNVIEFWLNGKQVSQIDFFLQTKKITKDFVIHLLSIAKNKSETKRLTAILRDEYELDEKEIKNICKNIKAGLRLRA